jgi:MOSC domain-containing protein YiiM
LRILSVNVSQPRDVRWKGKIVSTGIFKEPVSGPVRVGQLNLEGDRQADLSVHGGPDKAVYAYAAEHYAQWKGELGGRELPWGMFGENLTIEGGLYEDDVFVGDRFRFGTAELLAVQPRLPCFKLGIRFGTQRILKRFAGSGRYGVYFRVAKEGALQVGDPVKKIAESERRVSIGDVGRLLLGISFDPALLEHAAAAEALPENIRLHFQSLLEGGRHDPG